MATYNNCKYDIFLQDRLAADAWKIIAALKKEKGDLEVRNDMLLSSLVLGALVQCIHMRYCFFSLNSRFRLRILKLKIASLQPIKFGLDVTGGELMIVSR